MSFICFFSKNASFDFESSFKCAVCCGTQFIHSAGKNVPKRFQINSCSTSTMNLSDTSIDSSVQSGILDNGESDIAANLQVNLSVTSSIQSDRIQDAKSVQDLVAENNRLVQENDALKQRVAELEAAEAVGAGGGAGGGEAGGAAGGGAGGGGV